MGCGTSFAKILLIIFNIVFWLSGAGLLGVGIWMLIDPNVASYLEFLNFVASSANLLQYAAYLFIAVGAFVLIVGFFGCCGAIKENRCMLGVYIFLLVLVMGLEIAGGVLAIIYKDKINDTITKELKETFDKNYNQTTEQGPAFTEAMDVVQAKLKCCGITGPGNFKGGHYPLTCCVLKDEAMNKAIKTLDDDDAVNAADCRIKLAVPESGDVAYATGCEMKFKEWVETHAIILIGVGIGIACLELFGFIFAVCLCRSIQDDE